MVISADTHKSWNVRQLTRLIRIRSRKWYPEKDLCVTVRHWNDNYADDYTYDNYADDYDYDNYVYDDNYDDYTDDYN